VSYQTFAAGFSLAVYALFVVVCDRLGIRSAVFGAFGKNALAAYVLHGLIAGALKPFVPRDAPGWYVVSGLLIYLAINVVFVRDLEAKETFIRL
jgi:predicted acyltransferase